jgi:undecaprenyl-diphosphatase
LIGCAQAVAITPGISRSGSTISAGVLCGMRKSDAAEFSFLLAIPAIGGAALLELLDFIKECNAAIPRSEFLLLSVGFAVSAIVGYAALAGLIALLKKGKLGYFSYYLYIAALIVLVVETVKYC